MSFWLIFELPPAGDSKVFGVIVLIATYMEFVGSVACGAPAAASRFPNIKILST
jgi:hypothetical protein